jgi:hypothetical protein
MNRLDREAYSEMVLRDPDDPYLEVLKTRVDGVSAEISRRKFLAERVAGDPRGLLPPVTSDDLYEKLLARAEELRRRYPIDRFLEEMFSSDLRRTTNDRFKTRCVLPGHNDDHPSMVIYPEGKAWCFVCNAGGDIFDLTQSYFQLGSFWDAVAKLSEIAGLEPLASPVTSRKTVPENSSFPKVSHREPGRKEQYTVKLHSHPFRPIKVSGGKVVAS